MPVARAGRRAVTLVVVIVAAVSVLAIGSIGQLSTRMMAIARLVDEHRVSEEATRLWAGLRASPPPLEWVPREGGVRGAVEYLRGCTNPADRVFVFGFFPDVLYFSGRAAAADRVVNLRGFGIDPREERATVSALAAHPAAVALVETSSGGGSSAGHVLDGLHPLLERYVADHYDRAATTDFGGSTGSRFDVWVKRSYQARRGGSFDLPCLTAR